MKEEIKIIPITDNYYLKVDKWNWIIVETNRLVLGKNGEMQVGEDKERGYYGSLESALNGFLEVFLRGEVENGNIHTLTELAKAVSDQRKILHGIFGLDFKRED